MHVFVDLFWGGGGVNVASSVCICILLKCTESSPVLHHSA